MTTCQICGKGVVEADGLTRMNRTGRPGVWSCHEHADRVKCVMDGCRRTTAGTPGNEWMCGTHWRAFCPPRSRRRRAYLAIVREGRRSDWSQAASARYWRFWDTLVAAARRAAGEGSIDKAAIDRMFGWDQ